MTNGRSDRADTGSVDFHFDAMCPWAFQASLWIREVRREAGLQVNWRFFSLEEINRAEGKKHPWEREWSYGWSLMRVGALLRRSGMDVLDRWYEATASALHVEGRKPHRREVAEQIAAEIGLEPSVVGEALADESTHDEVRDEHQQVVDLGFFGVPTLRWDDGRAVFGPVIVEPPTGAEAVRLWHHVLEWSTFEGLYEMKQPKTPVDLRRIAEKFRPYLEARDWNTVQKEAP